MNEDHRSAPGIVVGTPRVAAEGQPYHPPAMTKQRPKVFFSMRFLAMLAFVFVFPALGLAASVRGKLSLSTASVGEVVDYDLEIQGGSPDRLPDFPRVDGLSVSGPSRNSSMLITGSGIKQTVTLKYRLTVEREGELTIPSFEVIAEGQKLSTQPVTLKVAAAARAAVAGDFAFGELRVVRKPAYVGEDVEVELLYFLEVNSIWNFSNSQAPALDGDGYSVRNPVLEDQTEVEMAGKRYLRVPFKSNITPNRAGKLTIGPTSMRFVYSKRLSGNMDRFGPIFEGQRQVAVTAPALELEVKPLPVEGRPKDFAGAIGDFQFSGNGRPNQVKVGEPVAMTLQITGRGNFDRIGAPALAEPAGWHLYPPTDRFERRDQLSHVGTKTFEILVAPETKKASMPVFNFSYFDPAKAKYVTLASAESLLMVEGEAPPAAPVVKGESPTAPKAAPAQDILGIRPVVGFWGAGWNPPAMVWLVILLAPTPVLAVLLVWRARRSDPRATRRHALLRERAALRARVRATRDRVELYDAAGRVLQIEVALATDQPAASVDEAAVLARTDAPSVRRLFASRADLVYAGSAGGSVTTSDRDEVMEALEQFGKGKR